MARKTIGKPRDPKPADAEDPSVADSAVPMNSDDAPDGAATTTPEGDTAHHIEDAEVVSETPRASGADAALADDVTGDTAANEASPVDDTARPEEPDFDPAPLMDATAPEMEPEPEPQPEPKSDTPPPPQAAPPASKPSVVPMLLGGAFAAALGYGAHMLTQAPPAPVPDIAGLEAELASLRADVQGLDVPAPFDPSALEGQIADLGTTITALETAMPQIDPSAFAALSTQFQSVVAGSSELATEVGRLRSEMAALQADMDDLRDLAQTRVADAEAAVDAAMASAGLDMLRAALDTGAPFDAAVSQIAQAGVAVPAPLDAVADAGIVTPEALIESYDASARAALRASLTDLPATSTTERLGNFLRAQVGARSTAPREGDDPDAVLSRAGAAVEAGDFDTALQELTGLPEAGRAAMADWIDAATARAAALAALPDLTEAVATRD